jgi:sugar lactone lactonase YvrE
LVTNVRKFPDFIKQKKTEIFEDWGFPLRLALVNPNKKSNLYVSDQNNHCIIKLFNMQVISPLPNIVADGSGANQLCYPTGIAVDSNRNLFIADSDNNRVMLWPPNSTSGSMIAGLGTAGSDSFSLYSPFGIFLDEDNSYICIADSANARIQRFSLLGGSSKNGTTVAGGNGQGSANNQLGLPYSVYVSNKIKVLYIADAGNSRIQRWNQDEQPGVTIAGDPNGNCGMLCVPIGIEHNNEEAFLYVADAANNRIQQFKMI